MRRALSSGVRRPSRDHFFERVEIVHARGRTPPARRRVGIEHDAAANRMRGARIAHDEAIAGQSRRWAYRRQAERASIRRRINDPTRAGRVCYAVGRAQMDMQGRPRDQLCVGSASRCRRASIRVVGASARGSASQSPRAIALFSTPVTLSAQRWPARPLSAARFCVWMLRTRIGAPARHDNCGIACTDATGEHGSRHDRAVAGERKNAIHGKAKQPFIAARRRARQPYPAGNA